MTLLCIFTATLFLVVVCLLVYIRALKKSARYLAQRLEFADILQKKEK